MNEKSQSLCLFLRFAFACAILRLERQQIGPDDYHRLKNLAESNLVPDEELIALCFPDAYSDYTSVMELCNLPPWTPETMLMFWLNHEGNSPTTIGIVIDKMDLMVTILTDLGVCQKILAYDIYLLLPRIGDRVAVHQRMLIMVLEQ